MNKVKSKKIAVIFCLCLVFKNFVYAGSFINIDGITMYKTEDGKIATSSWVWIDSDNDNIAECYRFDKDGHLAINYVHYDGKKTNEKGQYIENDKVIEKMVSTGRIVTKINEIYGPNILTDNNVYLSKNIILPKSMKEQNKRKINVGLNVGSDIVEGIEVQDGDIIDNTYKKYNPFSDIVAESGVIYSPGSKNNGIAVNESGEKYIPGFDAIKYISASKRFEKDVEEAVIYNGDTWKHCMALNGNNSSVKFTINKYNYMYFEYANENHTNFDKNTNDKYTDAVLSIYVDNILYEEIDDFTNGEPDIEEIDLEGKRTVEIKLSIKSGNKSERVYIRNAKFRKIKDE